MFSLLEGHERGELPRPEVRPRRPSARTTSTPATALDTLPSVVGLATVFGAGGGTSSLPGGGGHRRHRPLGLERPRDPPDLLPPRPQGRATAAPSCSCVDPRRTTSAAVGRPLARPRRRHRHRARQHHRRARSSTPASSQPTLHRAGDHAASTSYAASVEPWTLERGARGDRRAGRGHPRARPRLRHAPTAPSCAGRSASPSTTTPSTTCWRSSTWRCSAATSGATARASTRCAARTTCRAAATWARSRTSCPGFQDILDDDAARPRSSRPGTARPAGRARAAPHRHVRGHGARRPPRRSTCSARTRPSREADVGHARAPAGRPRPPRRAGHLPHQDRGAGRRRAAGRRGVVRDARARSPTASAGCSGCARRSTRPGDARDDIEIILRDRPPARPRLALRRRRGRLGRAARAVADARAA